ncbi:MAG: hypothetical protein CFH22_01447 [Alphaproteobacteria bacterium MarineAlpha5_Bin12]|nr:MAG: hypothetical protein CFH22_01447 [Alphaproteobacteria bacterium MarineAlpha5_Bin12]|tara:strand:- start:95 stop:472 length:378 start_codon:yes stop_codon:yes gene_type:complete
MKKIFVLKSFNSKKYKEDQLKYYFLELKSLVQETYDNFKINDLLRSIFVVDYNDYKVRINNNTYNIRYDVKFKYWEIYIQNFSWYNNLKTGRYTSIKRFEKIEEVKELLMKKVVKGLIIDCNYSQ